MHNTDNWDISYDIDDLIEPQNKKKNVFAKTPQEITKEYVEHSDWVRISDKEPYDWIKEQGQYEPFFGYSKEAHIEFMGPDEYLNKTKLIQRNKINRELSKEHIHEYKSSMKQGAKFPLPWLRYINNEITGQEGKHRVTAAKEIGIEKIPVAILDIDDKRTSPSSFTYNEKKKQNPFTYQEELI